MDIDYDEDGVSIDMSMDEACEFYMWLHGKNTSTANMSAHEIKFKLYLATKGQPGMRRRILEKEIKRNGSENKATG